MKLKYDFFFQQIGDQWAGVPVGIEAVDSNSMLHLNDVGHDIAEILSTDVDRDTLINRLLDMYDADREVITSGVDQALQYLDEQGLLLH